MPARAIRCPSCRTLVAANGVAPDGATCPNCHRPFNMAARHERAVAQTLRWADEAAARGDHADALEWLKIVEAVGDALSPDYATKRAQWRTSLCEAASSRAAP